MAHSDKSQSPEFTVGVAKADICGQAVSAKPAAIDPESGLPLEEFSIILSAKPIVISACRSSISRLQLHERFE